LQRDDVPGQRVARDRLLAVCFRRRRVLAEGRRVVPLFLGADELAESLEGLLGPQDGEIGIA
jgi:hypothetical protein